MRSLFESIRFGLFTHLSLISLLEDKTAMPAVCLLIVLSACGLKGLEAQTAHFSGVHTVVPTTGLNGVFGIAVDAHGNIYIADALNTRVVKETLSGGTYTQSVVTRNVGWVTGVAVDGNGNVYIADPSNDRLLKETLSGGSYVESTIATGLAEPNYVAVDVNGNVYVAGTGNSQGLNDNPVYKETPSNGGYTQSVIVSLKVPNGLAVDGSGNVYVIDYPSEEILKETPAGATYTQSVVPTSGLAYPAAIAADANGDVYVLNQVSDETLFKETLSGGAYIQSQVSDGFGDALGVAVGADGQVYVADMTTEEVFKVSASGDFGMVNVGQSGAAMTLLFTFDTAGTISKPAVLTQGAAGLDFADAGTGTCTTNGTTHSYSAGDTCTVDVLFTPRLPGARLGAAVLMNSAGVPIARGYVQGIGSGPEVNFLPGTQGALSLSSVVNPSSISVDAAGNLYIVDLKVANDPGNKIVKETWTGSVYTQTTITNSGFSLPMGLAVDGAGDVFIGDSALHEVLEETPSGAGYAQTVPFPNLSNVETVAVDGGGNIYIESDALGLLKETLVAGGYLQSTIDPTLFPSSIALDAQGNIFAVDRLNGRVVKEALSGAGYTQSVVVSGLNNPTGVAVDASGAVYIVNDIPGGQVVKETPSGTSWTQTVLASGLSLASSVAVDGSGNVYIAVGPDSQPANSVQEIHFADPPALTFASTAYSATSADSPQVLTIENTGNAELHFPVPATGSNPAAGSSFTVRRGGTSGCPVVSAGDSGAGTLAAGSSCAWSISFVPDAVGTINQSLVLTDDALNAASPAYATQTVALSGTGTANDFTLSVATGTSSSATVSAGGQASYTLAVAPTPGTKTAAAITLAASGLPSTVTASFKPASVAANSTATNVVLNVTASSTASARAGEGKPFRERWPIALALLALAGLGRVRKGSHKLKNMATMMLAVLAVATLLMACGGGGNTGGVGGGTPQTYTITVTGTAGSFSHSTTLTLTVQ